MFYFMKSQEVVTTGHNNIVSSLLLLKIFSCPLGPARYIVLSPQGFLHHQTRIIYTADPAVSISVGLGQPVEPVVVVVVVVVVEPGAVVGFRGFRMCRGPSPSLLLLVLLLLAVVVVSFSFIACSNK